MVHSGSRGPAGGRLLSQDSVLQTLLQTGQRGSCIGRNTACCVLSLFRIHLLSHAGKMTARVRFRVNTAAIDINVSFTSEKVKISASTPQLMQTVIIFFFKNQH